MIIKVIDKIIAINNEVTFFIFFFVLVLINPIIKNNSIILNKPKFIIHQ